MCSASPRSSPIDRDMDVYDTFVGDARCCCCRSCSPAGFAWEPRRAAALRTVLLDRAPATCPRASASCSPWPPPRSAVSARASGRPGAARRSPRGRRRRRLIGRARPLRERRLAPRSPARRSPDARPLRDRLRRARPRAAARAVGRGHRLPALVGGADDRGASRRRGRPGTAWTRSRSRGWTGAALAALEFAGVRGRDGAVPVEHVHGHAAGGAARGRRASRSSTATARTCACRSPTSRRRSRATGPRAAILVHIGGHIAFEVERIAALCRARGHLPDRGLRARARRRLARPPARARGATPACGRSTPPRRSRPARAACSSRATRSCSSTRARSATTASPTTRSPGLNFRLSEFTAALGLVQTERHATRSSPGRTRPRARSSTRVHPGRLRAARRDDLRALQVHRLRPDRALDRQGLRPAVPPHHGPPRRPAQHRLGRRAPLVRAAVLPARGERRRGAASGAGAGRRRRSASSTRGSAAAVRAPAARARCSRRRRAAAGRRRRASVRGDRRGDRRPASRGASSRGPSATTAAASSRARARRAARASE